MSNGGIEKDINNNGHSDNINNRGKDNSQSLNKIQEKINILKTQGKESNAINNSAHPVCKNTDDVGNNSHIIIINSDHDNKREKLLNQINKLKKKKEEKESSNKFIPVKSDSVMTLAKKLEKHMLGKY
jgi:hypothetical protein